MSLSPSLRQLGDARAADVAILDPSGNQLSGFDASRPATATLTSVSASITSVTLVAANPARRRVVIVNDTGKNLFVAFGATATTTAYTVLIAAKQTYSGPLGDYTGVISGIWQSADPGAARITEITT